MARSVILGNGGLTVGLDETGFVNDFYYPYVGLNNLTTARNKPHHIGIWVDGEFSWLNSDEWQRNVAFQDDALVSEITMKNEKLQMSVVLQDFVDAHHNILGRKVTVQNLSQSARSARMFFHQVFEISRDGRADTAIYIPDENYILDYKGHCSILAYAEVVGGNAMDQYAVGNAGVDGKEGTFRDAEDGELSMSAVEHAGVDSTLRVSFELEAASTKIVHYWTAVADSQLSLNKLHHMMLGGGLEVRLQATLQHWHDWIRTGEQNIPTSVSDDYRKAIKKSLLVIKSHIDNGGGIIASCDSSIYNYGKDYYSYVWPRDGACVIWPLIRLGYKKEPKKFFDFCKNIIHPDGYLLHKYQPDKAIGSTWHPLIHGKTHELAIQEDETAIVLFMIGEYLSYSNDVEYVKSLYKSFVQPAADFMSSYIDPDTGLPHASYDLWEEKFLTNTYTTAVTCRALRTAAEIANMMGIPKDKQRWSDAAQVLNKHSSALFNYAENHYNKGYLLSSEGGMTVDSTLDVSSFYGVFRYGFGKKDHLVATKGAIEQVLLDRSPSGGSPRYENDGYFRSEPAHKGNPWIVTTLWMAQYYAANNQKDKAKGYIDWAFNIMSSSGMLSEQIAPEDSSIVGVTPLIWSHAELINTILDVSDNK